LRHRFVKLKFSVLAQILSVLQPDARLFLPQAAAFNQDLLGLRLHHDPGAPVIEHALGTLVD
jgi:hypothetical protein